MSILPKDELLKGLSEREALSRILDLSQQAIRNWETILSDFLSPRVLHEAQLVLNKLTEINYLSWGGYLQAERTRLAISRADLPLEQEQVALSVLEIAGNFLFDPVTHRDFLGAILSTGIVRDKVGDIIVLGERGAQVIVMPEIADFLSMSLTQVRTVPVKTRLIDLSELKIRPPQTKQINTVEASLRLDAIASAGFALSRSKMSDAISAGDVRVNWKEITQPSYNLSSGDLISMRGKGRLEIGEVEITKKQRYRVQLTRYT
jgi:photosystem II S4 domain protein